MLWFRNIWFYIQSKTYKTCTNSEWIKNTYTIKNKYADLNIWIQQKIKLNVTFSLNFALPKEQKEQKVSIYILTYWHNL